MPWWLRRVVDFINWLAAQVSGRKYRTLARHIGREPDIPTRTQAQRSFVAVQIDGLAYDDLLRAMALGYTPTLQRLLAQGYRLHRWRCGVPSSTPAVQAGIMYGTNWDIPAFRWYEKEEGLALTCRFPPHVMRVKVRVANGRRGLLEGGSSYANLLDGDARLALFTLSAMGRHRFFEHLRGLGWLLLFLLIPWRIARVIGLALWELLRDLGRTIALWVRSGFRRQLCLVKPVLLVLMNVIFSELQTFSVLLDIYRGVPAIYVSFYGYDEAAHEEGPLSREALRALKRIDSCVRQIDRVRRTYRPDMDLYVFSDHGMTPTDTFQKRCGRTLAAFVASYVRDSVVWDEGQDGLRWRMREANFLLDELDGIQPRLSPRGQRLLQALRQWVEKRTPAEEDDTWDLARSSDVVVRSSGNLAHIYFNVTRQRMEISELSLLYPGLLQALLREPAIGLVLGLEGGLPAILTPSGPVPLSAERLPAGLSDPARTAADLARLVSFPHSGDLVLLGAWDGHRRVVSFEEQMAGHGGTGGAQDYPFFLTPPDVPLDLSGITNAEQLYPYFMARYQGMQAVSEESGAHDKEKLVREEVATHATHSL